MTLPTDLPVDYTVGDGGHVAAHEAANARTNLIAAAVNAATHPPLDQVGRYILPCCQNTVTTSVTLGNGTLRLSPWVAPHALSIDRIGGDVSTVGESGSKLRLGIYGDNGHGYPGALLLDAGQIAGDSATVQELTCDLDLPAGLYWIGGAVQAATTTQPTVRITSGSWTPPIPIGMTSMVAGGTALGYQQTSVTGALPSTFTASPVHSGSAPRVHVRLAA